MLTSIHAQMIHQALGEFFSPRALQGIIAANLGQDGLRGQLAHEEYHFDNNAFEKSCAYLDEQRRLTLSALKMGDAPAAWAAFGRLTHTAQDFYSHSNYVALWLARHADPTPPAPREIDPVDPDLVASPELHSGKLYYPQEALYFIPALRTIALSFLPRDSHAHMNLDSAERGPNFEYAFQAAAKRTRLEFEQIRSALSVDELAVFADMGRAGINLASQSAC